LVSLKCYTNQYAQLYGSNVLVLYSALLLQPLPFHYFCEPMPTWPWLT
jgi:hypothetical protein